MDTARRHLLFGLEIVLLLSLVPTRPTAAQANQSKAAPSTGRSVAPADPPLIDLAGYNRILTKYRGKPLLVNFWATWCEPCRYEYPMIVDLANHYAPRGLIIVGVSLDDDSDMNLVRHFLARNQPDFPNFRQKPGIDTDAFLQGVNPGWNGAIPSTIFYGRDGQIVEQFVGTRPRAAFEEAIREILAATPGKNKTTGTPASPN
jgi:thiol-disulfide isomerase/thioredoxin